MSDRKVILPLEDYIPFEEQEKKYKELKEKYNELINSKKVFIETSYDYFNSLRILNIHGYPEKVAPDVLNDYINDLVKKSYENNYWIKIEGFTFVPLKDYSKVKEKLEEEVKKSWNKDNKIGGLTEEANDFKKSLFYKLYKFFH